METGANAEYWIARLQTKKARLKSLAFFVWRHAQIILTDFIALTQVANGFENFGIIFFDH